MTPTAEGAANAVPLRWWRRLHAALMPDYNAAAAAYWWVITLLGSAVIAACVVEVARWPAPAVMQVAFGVAVAMLAGVFPVRIPNSRNSFAAGEILIFLALLMHGPTAAVRASAGEAAVGSWRTSMRWTSRLASPSMAALAMGASGLALQALLRGREDAAAWVTLATIGVALGYFVLNTPLATMVARLKRKERLQWSDLFGVFGWIGMAFAGSAAVAALLYLVFRQSGHGVLMAMVPLVGMMLATLHFFDRQQEATDAARRSHAEAAERETELAARHVRELEASERRFHAAFTHASIGMVLLGYEGRLLQVNPALRSLLGRTEETLRELNFQALVHDEDHAALQAELGLVDQREFKGFALKLRCRCADGKLRWVAAHCSFFSEPGASSPCLILQVQYIQVRRRAEEGLHHIAFHDSLTGLPNRRRFHEHLGQAVSSARGPDGPGYAVMFLDFDRFKLINDSYGHSAGDEFLVPVARRITQNLRPHDIVARLGGDEFAVLVQPLEDERTAAALADRLMEALKHPFHVAGNELNTSASIGITFSAFCYDCAEDVLRDADTAMYKAKAAGKARYALFDASLHTEVAELHALRQLGVQLAVDDFGTGYSSLSHLSTFPIDTLKIDRSFVSQLSAGSNEAAAVRAIVLLGQSLGKTNVAESIETAEQHEQLKAMGCALGQGYHLGRPMPAEAASALLDSATPPPQAQREDVAEPLPACARAKRCRLTPTIAPCTMTS